MTVLKIETTWGCLDLLGIVWWHRQHSVCTLVEMESAPFSPWGLRNTSNAAQDDADAQPHGASRGLSGALRPVQIKAPLERLMQFPSTRSCAAYKIYKTQMTHKTNENEGDVWNGCEMSGKNICLGLNMLKFLFGMILRYYNILRL